MTKKPLVTVLVVLAAFLTPQVVLAKTVCTQEYGQPVVCHDEEEKVLAVKHEPVEADLADMNPALIGAGFLLASGIFLYLSKRVKTPYHPAQGKTHSSLNI